MKNLKLQAKLIEAGANQQKGAKIIDVAMSTFSKKINGEIEFKESEINKLLNFFEEKGVEAKYEDIFLP